MKFSEKDFEILTEEWDEGAEKILENLEQLKEKPFVKVGILESAGNHKKKGKKGARKKADSEGESETLTVADIATMHEYGAVTHRGNVSWDIPERSFMRASMTEKESDLEEKTVKIFDKIIDGDLSVKDGLNVLGMEISKNFKNKIDSNIPPPLADSTIRAKTRDGKTGEVALVDTGQMRNAISHEVEMEGGEEHGEE